MFVQELFPVARESSVADLYSDSSRVRRVDRPWIIMSMIASADGAVSIEGVSGGLGGPADRAVFRHLRSLADGVLVGAETVRRESYSPLPSHQTLVVVSRTSDLGDRTEELLAAGNTRVVRGECHPMCSTLSGDVWILEGGPNLNAQMLAANCVDEICLTVAPSFVAGDAGRIVSGVTASADSWKIAHIASDGDFVFLRYKRK